jgi:hypothetical protein
MSSIARCSNSSATGRSPLFSAFDAVGFDQFFEVALGDETAGQKVQPDRLAMLFEGFDRIHGALCSSLGSSTFSGEKPGCQHMVGRADARNMRI